jgi:hypothetical protein
VLAKDNTLLGMGAGQPNRVTSVRLAVERAGERARGSVVASDAYFPFFDGIATAAIGGVTAAPPAAPSATTRSLPSPTPQAWRWSDRRRTPLPALGVAADQSGQCVRVSDTPRLTGIAALTIAGALVGWQSV